MTALESSSRFDDADRYGVWRDLKREKTQWPDGVSSFLLPVILSELGFLFFMALK